MIEWEDDDLTRSAAEGSWHVSWTGKTTVLPADDRPSDSLRRFYFLLPPNTTIPPSVTLFYEPKTASGQSDAPSAPSAPSATQQSRDTFQLNPLPAIFPPELGKRLRVLEREIRDECLNNVEGVALHMAMQEQEWIETNFGVTARTSDVASSRESSTSNSLYPTGPVTPNSPVSGRKLTDKLKGLKLQTSEKDLSANDSEFRTVLQPQLESLTALDSGPNTAHLLSPQSPDVAVSSFSAFSNVAKRTPHSMPTPDTNPTPTPMSHVQPSTTEPPKPVALHPPESLQEAQKSTDAPGFAPISSMSSIVRSPSTDSGEELFAKALSPRSPDLPRSPFSFA
ncbi:hypothetical protein N7450_006759 [Penicillium hetheringtonii]|uniref:Uncharacterized protein n=1 Tax=Penicillium hetheringtonii TaxID=911720 RepID=A0AAD6DG40_9EURO|nr:hypothetical protein N7450_006759 [Penicillium hetheringtonii]